MERIYKTNPPDCFNSIVKKFKQPYKSKDWEDDKIGENRTKLREHILENEQNGKCAYCCCCLKLDSSHIDHFLKRELFEDKTFCYENLFVSCCSNNHCGRHKDIKLENNNKAKEINNKFIKPTENISNFFTYDLTLRVFNSNTLNSNEKERAELTIDYFNLNHAEIINNRKQQLLIIIRTIKGFSGSQLNNYLNELLKTTHLRSFILAVIPELKRLSNNTSLLQQIINSLQKNKQYSLLNSQ